MAWRTLKARRVWYRKYYVRNKHRLLAKQREWHAAHADHLKRYRTKPEVRFRAVKHSAKRRGIRFTLTFRQYCALTTKGECHYCHKEITTGGGRLDRKKSNHGYTYRNCIPCCVVCNLIRGRDLISYEEMIQVAKLLCQLRGESWHK